MHGIINMHVLMYVLCMETAEEGKRFLLFKFYFKVRVLHIIYLLCMFSSYL